MKLISMTDFVLEQSKRIMNVEITHLESHEEIVNYARFLKQPLKLEMFIPCDEYGNVLTGEPLSPAKDSEWIRWENESEIYLKKKSLLTFKGFELNKRNIKNLDNIFCLTKDKFQLTFFKNENSIFLDNLITNQTFKIFTIEDLIIHDIY
jgi:hypothetical protein